MLLYWYSCISVNTYCYVIYHISLETVWWAFSNTILIMWIHPVIHEILANKDFTVTDDLISWLFVVNFVHPTYVQIALIWGFIAQFSLWKLVYWLWRYKLNEVCNKFLSKKGYKLQTSVWDHVLRKTVQFPDIVQEKLCYSFYYDSSMDQNKISLFWHRIHHYHYYNTFRRLRKFHYKINTHDILLKVWNW